MNLRIFQVLSIDPIDYILMDRRVQVPIAVDWKNFVILKLGFDMTPPQQKEIGPNKQGTKVNDSTPPNLTASSSTQSTS